MATNPTGVSQDTLNAVLRAGQYNNMDAAKFNSSSIDALAQQQAYTGQAALSPIQITAQNAPNTTFQNRQLTNQFLDTNRQAFQLQGLQIDNQVNMQQQALTRGAKDAINQNMLLYGSSGATDSRDSSRNLSNLTSTEAKLSQELNNIRMKGLELSGQNTLNYAQGNLQGLQMNRQADFQDRGFNLQESLQRGQETGMQFEYNPDSGKVENTGRLNLAGKAIEAEMTGDYTTFGGNKVRSLAGLQIDAALVTSSLNNAIGVAGLTGQVPDLAGIKTPTGQYNPNFDFSRSTGRPTQDALLNAGAIAQSGYNSNLYNTMTDQGLYKDQVEAERSNINTAISSNLVTRELNKQTLDYYASNIGPNAAGNLADYDKAYNILKDPTSTPEQRAGALQTMETSTKSITDKFGEGVGLYYNAMEIPETDSKGVITGFKTKYTPDKNGLIKYGVNFDVDFNSNSADEGKMQKDLETQFKNLLTVNDLSKSINKLIVSGADNKDTESYLALARRNGDPKKGEPVTVGNGYEFIKLDTSQMSQADRVEFTAQVAKARAEGPAELESLNNLLKQYESKNKLVVNRGISAPDFISNMRRSRASDGTFLAPNLPNDKLARSIFLSNNNAFRSLIQRDPSLTNFDNNFATLRSSLDMIQENIGKNNNTNVDPTEVLNKIRAGFKSGSEDSVTLSTGQRITLPKLDANIVTAMQQYLLQNSDNLNYAKNMIAASLPLAGKDSTLAPGTFKIGGNTYDITTLFEQPKQ